MMPSDDDEDMERRLKVVDNYYFVDDDDAPVSFDVLPFQIDAAEEVPSFKTDVYLRGFSDGGLQKVYKQVVAWKLGLDAESESPDVTVLSTEGSWVVLLRPRSSYRETVRSVLITVEMLHFVRRNPTVPENQMWGHLHRVFGNYEIRPSVDDFRDHVGLLKLFAERDQAIAKSQTLQLLLSEYTVEKGDKIAQNTVENIDKVDQNSMEMIDKAAKNTVEKINMVGSDDMKVKHPFIADRDEREELVEDSNKHESCNDDEETDEEDDLFDSICAICDNGGELLCCEGSCMRSFHAKIGDGEDSYCATLGYRKAELEAIKRFMCKNCEYNQHQCFVCGKLEPSDGPNAKVFLCNNATCGHFYHPKCVTQKLHPNNRNEALQLEKSIVAGFSFTCPVHWCFECKGLEDRTQEPLQFAVCRRCPRSYHRKCLPREISFEETDEMGIVTRAWELSKRILIYCMDHDIDLDIGTPSRDHLKFPRVAKPVHSVKNKVKELAEKKRLIFDDSYCDEPVKKSSRRVVSETSFEQSVKKKTKYHKDIICPEESLLQCHAVANSPNQTVNKQEQELATLSLPMKGKTPESSFPVVDSETEKRVIALVEKEISSLTLDNIYRRCAMPSTHASSGRQLDKIITQGKLERSVQAVQAALQKLENGGTADDAKAVCEAEVLRQITRWHNKLRVYLAPCIHGMRYTSFGRHFTKKEKLIEIVDKLHWYVQPGDTIVDFSCGLNDFSQFMKEKLDKVGKRCNFKNFDVIRPMNSFCFEKRDWMTVHPEELPHGSKLIMGLNPPFGMKARLADKFIDKALSFKPKLIILIVPKETQRLDQKQQPYDLIWEDTGSLSGRSFYLPGSLDVTDKQMDQWNVSPPPLYLWSNPDWTQKHRKIAEGHGHTTSKVVSHSKQMDCRLDDIRRQNHGEFPYEQNDRHGDEKETYMTDKVVSHSKQMDCCVDDIHIQNHGEVPYDQNDRYGYEKDTYMTDESVNFVVEKPERVFGLPPEKLVEVAYEEKRAASGRGGTFQSNQSGIHFEERVACSDFRVDRYNEKKEEIEGSNCFRWRTELQRTGDATKADSDMSISPSDSRNLQYKSRSDSPHMSNEYSSEIVDHQDNYVSDPVENMPYDNYIRNVADYGVASVEKHLADAMIGDYVGGSNSNFYTKASGESGGSFYSNKNLQENHTMQSFGPVLRNAVSGRNVGDVRMYGHIQDDHTQTATAAADIRAQTRMSAADLRAQIRIYGGQAGDSHPRTTAMNPLANDVRVQIRMYGRHTYGYSDPQFVRTAPYGGISSLDSTGRSAMDRYTPRLHETNYTAGQFDVPDNRRDMAPNPRAFSSRQQYPYPHPGSSGGWPC